MSVDWLRLDSQGIVDRFRAQESKASLLQVAKINSGPWTNRQLNRHWPLCPGIKGQGERLTIQIHLGQRWGYENAHRNLHFPICLRSMQMNFAFTSTTAHTLYAVQCVTELKGTKRQRKLKSVQMQGTRSEFYHITLFHSSADWLMMS